MASKQKTVLKGIHRIACNEIKAVSAELGRTPLKPENIHEARRHLKKLRALLRLLRTEIPKAIFAKENRFFRDIGRKLSPVRDARVLVKTAESLRKKSEKRRQALARFVAILKGDETAVSQQHQNGFAKLIDPALGRVERWPMDRLTEDGLLNGIQKTFRRGRKAFHKTQKNRDDKRLHDLRKRAKDLEHHLRLLKQERICGRGKRLKTITGLADCLGADHDLAMLNARLNHEKFLFDPKDNQKIAKEICRRRSKLQKSALKLAKKIYAEKPARFARKTVPFK